jgi:hypothetical protein
MPVIFKKCGACGKQNSIPVGNARPLGRQEHKCECGTGLFRYSIAPDVEPSGSFSVHASTSLPQQ